MLREPFKYPALSGNDKLRRSPSGLLCVDIEYTGELAEDGKGVCVECGNVQKVFDYNEQTHGDECDKCGKTTVYNMTTVALRGLFF